MTDSTVKRSLLNKISLQLVLFLFFYNIPLHLFKIPFSSGKLVSMLAVSCFVVFLLVKNRFNINKEYLKFIQAVAIVFLVVFVITEVFYSTPDNYYLNVLTFYIFEYLFGAYIIVHLFKLNSLTELIRNLIYLAVIQSVIMFGSLFLPALKDFVVAVMEANTAFANFSAADKIKNSFRGLSLASDRTLGLSVFLSISIMLIYTLFVLEKKKLSYFKYILFFILIFIGGVLAARTFFVGLFFGLIFMFFINFKYSNSSKKLKKYFKRLLISFVSIVLLIPAIISIFFADIQDEISLAFDWAFEMFFNLFDGGKLDSASADDLFENHLKVIPQDLQTWIIGDPNRTFINGTHYMGTFTDSGYLRMLFIYGLIGSIAVYLFWIYIFLKTSKLYAKIQVMRVLFLFIATILFVAQIKYDVFPGSALNFKIIVLFFVFGVEQKNNKQIVNPQVLEHNE